MNSETDDTSRVSSVFKLNFFDMKRTIFLLCFFVSLGLYSCEEDDSNQRDKTGGTVSAVDVSQYSSGSEVMIQAFYWDVPKGGIWWDFLKGHIDAWSAAGIDKVWLPQFAKSGSGGFSMGYDVADYFDLGEYDQYGSVETRFGSKTELLTLINRIHEAKMEVIADIVINHNGGGAEELNTVTGEYKHTLFTPEAGTNLSGRFNRNWQSFNLSDSPDEGNAFYPERDLCLQCPYVQEELWINEHSVAKYYKNELGIDGWRFDYVKGFSPEVIKSWNEATGNMFSVGENWDGDTDVLTQWVEASGSAAFDFAAYYNMEKAFDSKRDLSYLKNDALFKHHPDKAVTFAGNHDTDGREDSHADNVISPMAKPMAYAYMMTHPGIPTIFYTDYQDVVDREEMNRLIAINKSIAKGKFQILHASKYEYIARRAGDANNPGLIIYMNISSSPKKKSVVTAWEEGQVLYDYAENDQSKILVQANGLAEISVNPNSYSIWSLGK